MILSYYFALHPPWNESQIVSCENYDNLDSCKQIFQVSSTSRRRRDHHDATHDEWAQKYLSWLTNEQREELKALHEANDDHDEIRDKVLEFFEAAAGEVKAKATEELQVDYLSLISLILRVKISCKCISNI